MLLQSKTSNQTVAPFMTNEELKQILLPLIDPQYQINIKNWKKKSKEK